MSEGSNPSLNGPKLASISFKADPSPFEGVPDAGTPRSIFEIPPLPASSSSSLMARSKSQKSTRKIDLNDTESTSTTGATEIERTSMNQQESMITYDMLTSETSWIKRVQSKTEEVRKLFDLPITEQLMDDYMCALRKKVLLQGRMYIFEHHLCFYSNLFGHQKVKIIPLETILDVRKKKNIGFPNSIEITWAVPHTNTSKKEFFTSFISREDAYRLLLGLWAQHSELGKDRINASDAMTDEDVLNSSNNTLQVGTKRPSKKRSSKANCSIFGGNTTTGGEAKSQNDTSITPESVTDDELADDGLSPALLSGDEPSMFLLDGQAEDGHLSDLGSHRDSIDQHGGVIEPGSVTPASLHYVPEFVAGPSGDKASVDREFQAANESAPELPSDMQKALEIDLDCSPREFWLHFLSSQSEFFFRFHEKQGHRNIKLDHWQKHYKIGTVRDLRFISMFKGWKGSQQEALCHQTQRYRIYKDDHIVFDTSQVMSEIPYSDHFKVETRWDITPLGGLGNRCHVQVHVTVPFVKSTIWRKLIERTVTDGLIEALTVFKDLAAHQLETKLASDDTVTPLLSDGANLSPSPPVSRSASLHRAGSGGLPSRDTLPETNEEWEALLSQVPLQWRDGLRSLRKTQLSAVIQRPVGHRRRGSKGGPMDGFGSQFNFPNSSGNLTAVAEGRVSGEANTIRGSSPKKLPPSNLGPSASQSRSDSPTFSTTTEDSYVKKNALQIFLCVLLVMVLVMQLVLIALQIRRPVRPFGSGIEDFSAILGQEFDVEQLRAAVGYDVKAVLKSLQMLQRDAEVWQGKLVSVAENAGNAMSAMTKLQEHILGDD